MNLTNDIKSTLRRTLYNLFPSLQQYNFYLGKWRYAKKLKSQRNKTLKRFHQHKGLLVNIGCGSQGRDGWINIDFAEYKGINCTFDCSKDLPFEDNSVKAIFTEHFLEHLDYEKEAQLLLADCFRVLETGGVIRIVVPDAEKFLIAYNSPGWEALSVTRPLTSDFIDCHLGIKYNTKMELVNVVFHQFGEHKFAYDYETLKFCLEKTGFSQVKKMSFGESRMKELAIDLKVRESESLYVEAIK
ncbi:family 2 glycosyl transferase [Tolypothrix tenuis PCC 7101]|uniref:Family 2 glycosyl transferase n=1 Tax=Tolypothrix tenuis PCC 7101 TaxID=231146 RepID=A0A1Z4N872_9CYAN|nr:methyltransferase domain-containing protein [Aulosira sp. FACHB-113]BAZ01852.1 family 2 glycosyl transferase [Tolypothrix tenuis PCC 7101]BAZ74223.1 family 2 glycosyl transferase [Aulosira laxa NIES-50]